MITVITFNPSIDTLYNLEFLKIGCVQRVENVKKSAGGKGINVARVLKQLGITCTCTGFLGGYNGLYIKDELKKIDIKDEFIKIDGETRVCLNIIDENKKSTEILEKGPFVKDLDIIRFERHLETILDETTILVASGSLLQGLDEQYYNMISIMCEEKNIKFILDTSGKYLEKALGSKIYLIKPNIEELEYITKTNIKSKDDVIYQAKKLLDKNIENVCVSMGKDGMIFLNKDNIYEVKIPEVEIENTVGSGDSSIAGFVYGLANNYNIQQCLKLSNACGISNAMNSNTGYVEKEKVKDLISKIDVLKYSL